MSNDQIKVIDDDIRPYTHIYIDYLSLSDRELKVFLALKSFAWGHKNDCYPSIARVAEISGKKTRQTIEILQMLKDKGLIIVETRKGASSIYRITGKVLKEEIAQNKNNNPCGKPHTPPADIRTPTHADIRTLSSTRLRKQTKQNKELMKSGSQVKTFHEKDFFPDEANRDLLTHSAMRTKQTEEYLLSRFEEISLKYKTQSNDWQKTFGEFLTRELPKKLIENKGFDRERSSNEPMPVSNWFYADQAKVR